MMKLPVHSLNTEDGTLNIAVALAAGLVWQAGAWYQPPTASCAAWRMAPWNPCSDHAQAVPLLDQAFISTKVDHSGVWLAWDGYNYLDEQRYMMSGSTRLEAGLRTFVARKFGGTVDIPDALLAGLRVSDTREQASSAAEEPAEAAARADAVLQCWRLDGVASGLAEIASLLAKHPDYLARGNSVVHFCAHRARALSEELAAR
jgi:hypothetical protein